GRPTSNKKGRTDRVRFCLTMSHTKRLFVFLDTRYSHHFLRFLLVIDRIKVEAEEVKEVIPVAGDIREFFQVLSRNLPPQFSHFCLYIRTHFPVIYTDSAFLI